MKTTELLKISIVVPVYNAYSTLDRCLSAITGSNYPNYECIVVDDASDDGSPEIMSNYPIRIISLPGVPLGPAHARNIGAENATGQIILFIDSDVVIYPDTLEKVANFFSDHLDYSAVFGAYDDQPSDEGFLSQYKNLLHHFVHMQSNPEASTFWSGCGAIRRDIFLASGGFDAQKFPKPSIEDIELGARLRVDNYRITLLKDLRVKHLKRWTLKGLLKTDICDRAIPWTLLILKQHHLPNDLNLSKSQRVSAVLSSLLLILLVLLLFNPGGVILFLLGLMFFAVLNFRTWPPQFTGKNGFHFIGPPTKMFLTYAIIGLTIGVAYFLDILWLVPVLIFFCLLYGLSIYYSNRPSSLSDFRAKLVFILMVILILGSAIGVVPAIPLVLLVPALVLILLIVFLNHRLYRFYYRKHRIIFMLGTIPLQILYYLYSTLAFCFALVIHAWKSLSNSRSIFKTE